jgi:hypothetical protein
MTILKDSKSWPLVLDHTPASFNSEFEVIRRKKVYEEVAEQIERLILAKFKPGVVLLY